MIRKIRFCVPVLCVMASVASAQQPAASQQDAVIKALRELQQQVQELKNQNVQLRTELDEIKSTAGNTSKAPALKADVAALKQDRTTLEADLISLRQQINATTAGLTTLSETADAGCTEAAVEECQSSSIYASVDFLNWQVARSNLEFVHKDNPAIPASVLGVGETIGVDHSYTGGFRLGLGRRSCSGWDYGATYTSFESDSNTTIIDPTESMFAIRIHADSVSDIGEDDFQLASADYDIDMDVVDLVAGYRFDVGCAAGFRPYGGLRIARIDQRMTTTYSEEVDLSGDVTVVDETLDMSALGFVLGSEGHWNINDRLHLFGRGAAAVMVATSRNHHREFEPDDDVVNVDMSVSQRDVISSLEAAAGIGYVLMDDCRGAAELQVGWEFQNWIQLADSLSFPDDVNDGTVDRNRSSLGFDGLVIRLTFTR